MALANVNDIATFVAVVKAGSFTIAARQLGMTRSGVGKGIARLEERLGARLIHRTPRSLGLTDDGTAFYDRCVHILDELEDVETGMAERTAVPAGMLRITVPVALGRLYVLPVVESLLKKWPNIRAEMQFTDRYVDLVDEGLDLAIRVGGLPDDSRLIARQFAVQRLITVASPDYLAARGEPATPADLVHHAKLFFSSAGRPQYWDLDDVTVQSQRTTANLVMDSAEALVESAARGQGIARMPSYLLATLIREGKLVRILADHEHAIAPISVVYPTRRHLAPKVRALIDEISAAWTPAPPWERPLA